VFSGTVRQEHELVSPPCQRDEQRQQNGADEQRLAQLHIDRDSSHRCPQHEPCRDREDVQAHDDVLEYRRAKEFEREVAGRHQQEEPSQHERTRESHSGEEDRRGKSQRHRNQACRDRPLPFERVFTVGFAVHHIVREVHRSRQPAEDEEGCRCGAHGSGIKQPSCEHEARKDH
jgi:hypothetical protein